MTGGAFEHIGHCFDAAMWMVGETTQWTFQGIVKSKMVEQQEWVELVADAWSDGSAQFDPCTFNGNFWFDHLRDSSKLVHVV
jgi:hypothetical protein